MTKTLPQSFTDPRSTSAATAHCATASHRPTRRTPRMAAVVASIGLIAALPACRPDANTADQKPRSGSPTAWFEEVSTQAGLTFVHTSGHAERFWFPEVSTGGVALLDYDADAALDVYLVQGGDLNEPASTVHRNRMFRNRGDDTFEDVTDAVGVGDAGYGMGCACGDYDADGDVDLFVTNLGPNVLYRNNGDGTFTDVTAAAGLGHEGWGSSAAFFDYDNDGALDLFVSNYVGWSRASDIACSAGSGAPDYCSPNNYNRPAPDVVYRNAGDGTFQDVTEACGVSKAFGNGFGVACGDYNLDGHLDVYVANDGMANQLWVNQGDGTFRDEALLAGCAVNMQGTAEAGMGAQAVDVDHDGDLDLFLTHLLEETNTFYVNEGGWFRDDTPASGLAAPSVDFTGFGVGFADFDHDGGLDVYVANGRVKKTPPFFDPEAPYAEPNQLFTRRPATDTAAHAPFEEVLPRGGTQELLIHTSRAAAFGDLDNDGDVDIVVVNKDGPAYLLRNTVGDRGNWIMFRTIDARGLEVLYARVTIACSGRTQTRQSQRAYSFYASNDPRVHFGLGSAERVDTVSVRWPDGETESFGPFPANAVHTLQRGAGRRANAP